MLWQLYTKPPFRFLNEIERHSSKEFFLKKKKTPSPTALLVWMNIFRIPYWPCILGNSSQNKKERKKKGMIDIRFKCKDNSLMNPNNVALQYLFGLNLGLQKTKLYKQLTQAIINSGTETNPQNKQFSISLEATERHYTALNSFFFFFFCWVKTKVGLQWIFYFSRVDSRVKHVIDYTCTTMLTNDQVIEQKNYL